MKLSKQNRKNGLFRKGWALASLLVCALALEPTQAWSYETTPIAHHPKVSAEIWCNEVNDYIRDLLVRVHSSSNPRQSRVFLLNGIQDIVRAYNSGGLSDHPLTYSLLKRAQSMNAVFPDSEKGNQAGAIVLNTLLRSALRVNEEFDSPNFMDVLASYRQCHRRHCERRGEGWIGSRDLDPAFYTSYIASISTVLDAFFGQALGGGMNASVFDAMGEDRWELLALQQIMDWVVFDLNSDLFGRRLGCLRIKAMHLRQTLNHYLRNAPVGGPSPRFEERGVLRFVEAKLDEIHRTLDSVTWTDAQGFSCHRYSPTESL